ncbi:N-formylglutamate amidohydrolase [Rhizobium alarense]|uniref:N-formylglutamate amidohydrolase n=1 Tax=Rhizobium alarense TaxID=2846851 RepID=UPI0038B437C4
MPRGLSPVVGTAIHDGHVVRPELEALRVLSAEERRREEDPYTASIIADVPNRVVFHRSRFEIDLNRHRGGAVYGRPDQAWGFPSGGARLPRNTGKDRCRSMTTIARCCMPS